MENKKNTKAAVYLPPMMEVTHVEVEGPITASATPTMTQPTWTEDDSREKYDGDIWFPY